VKASGWLEPEFSDSLGLETEPRFVVQRVDTFRTDELSYDDYEKRQSLGEEEAIC
jgi:hypothetical protein